MSLNASVFLAMRYLQPRRSFVSTITLLAVLGPVLGVAVMIVVIAVMSGFGREIRQKILSMQAHVQLQAMREYMSEPGPMVAALTAKGYRASAVIEGTALVQTRSRILPRFIRGIDPKTDVNVSPLKQCLIAGKYEIGPEEALLGQDLANSLYLKVGDKLVIHPTGKLQHRIKIDASGQVHALSNDDVYVPEEVRIAGIFKVGMYDVDSQVVVVHLDKAADLFDLPWGSAQTIQIWTDDPWNLKPLLKLISDDGATTFAGTYPVTWEEANKQFFEVLAVEKGMQFFLLLIIVVVAGFSIMATLITVVIYKTREIGVLKALGASPLDIQVLFMMQGGMVGLVGILLGTGLGLLVVHYRTALAHFLATTLHIEIFPASIYQLPEIPAYVQTSDVLMVVGASFLICIVAATLPALYAASLTPTRALRTEA